jgi:hypothetical protein
MNDAQKAAAEGIEMAKYQLDLAHGEVAKAERRLQRAKAKLAREIRHDPAAWNEIAAVPG